MASLVIIIIITTTIIIIIIFIIIIIIISLVNLLCCVRVKYHIPGPWVRWVYSEYCRYEISFTGIAICYKRPE